MCLEKKTSYLLETGHTFNKNYEILLVENKSQTGNLLETLEINSFKKQNILLDDETILNNSPF